MKHAPLTLAERIRKHARSSCGGMVFRDILDGDVHHAITTFMHEFEWSVNLKPDERRMFCLFVAESLENPC